MMTVNHHLRGHRAESRFPSLLWLLAQHPGPQAPAADHGDSCARSKCLLVTVLYRDRKSTMAFKGHHQGPKMHVFHWKLPPSLLPSPPSR